MKNLSSNVLIGLGLVLFMLLQSCTAYYKSSLTLEEAEGKGKVQVVNNVGPTLYFKEIVLKDSVYYGVKRKQDVRIYTDQLSSIHLIDKKKTKRRSLITLASVLSGFYGITYLLFGGND